ncbi:DUF3667 domain-containing protein [Aquimarina sp. AU474]|uniref:DUF3667 domain-containing protein n=1 Tax=Aquimarina sp. AU474 TaxID=2108529 RepID=UPI000D68A7B2|nr:DUF3667 domain-containing protein [Aquimarina sp. AU474]
MSGLINISNCKNCGQQIESYNFCPDCGAKKITKRITFNNLISEFVDRFLNVDNSFTRTFTDLFTKPEVVIDGYIHGLRKRYVNAFGYFALSVTITGIYGFLTKGRMYEILSNSTSALLPKEQIDAQLQGLDTAYQYQSIFSFLFIPLLAIISRIVFLNYKKYNFTEHLVIYLYAYSHIVGVTSILLIPAIFFTNNYFVIAFVPFIFYFIYIGYVLKRLYALNLKKIILKTLLFFALLLGIVFLIMFVGVIFAVILGPSGVPTEAAAGIN